MKLAVTFSALLVILLITVFLLQPKKQENLTAASIKKGGEKVVCKDALMLYETFKVFVNEKLENSIEEAVDLRSEVFDNKSPAQTKLDIWHDEVILAIHERHKGNVEEIKALNDIIGNSFLRLYQAAVAVNIPLTDDETATDAIKLEFCAEWEEKP
jgi:hypothetical protein